MIPSPLPEPILLMQAASMDTEMAALVAVRRSCVKSLGSIW